MAHLIDKDALVAEIEKLINRIYAGRPFDSLSSEQQTALWYVKSIMSSINTLEVKEVDLEKELNTYLEVVKATDEDIDFVDFAKHFFELGLKAQKGKQYYGVVFYCINLHWIFSYVDYYIYISK